MITTEKTNINIYFPVTNSPGQVSLKESILCYE